MRVFDGADDVLAAVGEHLGHSEWMTITQEQVDQFADATHDHQWIHTDPERAKAGPFGGPIAHGYMTLALVVALGQQVYRFEGISMGINYGVDKVRFPQPVPVGSRVRAGVELVDATPTPQGLRVAYTFVIEIEGHDKPACVAQTLALLVP